jgi:hypothetical protein
MKDSSVVLGSGYASSEQAIAPLRSAIPWAKHIHGDVCLPESHLSFRVGAGKGRLIYRLVVQVKKEENGFATVATIEPFTRSEMILSGAAAALVFTLIGAQMPELLFVVVPLWILSVSLHAYQKLKSSHEVLRELASFYEEKKA